MQTAALGIIELQSILTKALSPVRAAAAILLMVAGLSACSTTEALDLRTPVPRLESEKYAAIVVDADSGKVIHEVDSGLPRYPASLTKMMTVYMLLEQVETGRLSRGSDIPVSAYAAGRPPTKIGFRAGDTIDVDSAIRALVTRSANDVAVAVAELLGGTEEQFAAMMTAKARSLGMRGTTFRNASGLPDVDQRSTARDMAILGIALRKRFPQYSGYFSQQSFQYRGKTIRGHNDLIGRVPGVDGMKTGYIRASGFNVCTSVTRGGKRYMVVVMGGKSARERNDHVEELIDRLLPRSAF
jgi:D-alanyl-D-alanine carboxypeptidase